LLKGEHYNKYLVRTVDLDIVTNNSNMVFIYSKLCRIALMTFLAPKSPKGLESARIYGGWGRFPESQEISLDGFADFLFDRASHIDTYFESLSPNQKENIKRKFEENAHRSLVRKLTGPLVPIKKCAKSKSEKNHNKDTRNLLKLT